MYLVYYKVSVVSSILLPKIESGIHNPGVKSDSDEGGEAYPMEEKLLNIKNIRERKSLSRIFRNTLNASLDTASYRYLRWGGDGEAVQPEKLTA